MPSNNSTRRLKIKCIFSTTCNSGLRTHYDVYLTMRRVVLLSSKQAAMAVTVTGGQSFMPHGYQSATNAVVHTCYSVARIVHKYIELVIGAWSAQARPVATDTGATFCRFCPGIYIEGSIGRRPTFQEFPTIALILTSAGAMARHDWAKIAKHIRNDAIA